MPASRSGRDNKRRRLLSDSDGSYEEISVPPQIMDISAMNCSGFSEHDITLITAVTRHRVKILEDALNNVSHMDISAASDCSGFNECDISANNHHNVVRQYALLDAFLEEVATNSPMASTMNNGQLAQCLNDANISTISDEEEVSVFGSFEDPNIIHEISLEGIIPPPQLVPGEDDEEPITYLKIEGATQNGKDVLVDSRGFEYIHKNTGANMHNPDGQTWECKVKHKGNKCNARYMPNRRGPNGTRVDLFRGEHNHPYSYKPEHVRELRLALKKLCMLRPYDPAGLLVNEIFDQHIEPVQFALHKEIERLSISQNALKSMIHYYRRIHRAPTIHELMFELDMSHIPANFMKFDGKSDDARFIIFQSVDQRGYMKNAFVWYIDATFRVVDKPFMQLFSVHVFVIVNNIMKQIPVAFVLMSRRRKEDYIAVFKALKGLVTDIRGGPKVVSMMLDFEAAMWSAMRDMMACNEFKQVKLRGCLFHFNQAIFRKILSLKGLKRQYRRDPGTERLCRHLMSLPYLPEELIMEQFIRVEKELQESVVPGLHELATYMRSTWIEGRMWTPTDWCQHGQQIRTNNNVEGYHNGLNQRVQTANTPFYGLTEKLHNEAVTVCRTVKQMYRGEITRRRKDATLARQKTLTTMWADLKSHTISPKTVLKKVSRMMTPNEWWAFRELRVDLDIDE